VNLRLYAFHQRNPGRVPELSHGPVEVCPSRAYFPGNGWPITDFQALTHGIPDHSREIPHRRPRPSPDIVRVGQAAGLSLQSGLGGLHRVGNVGHLSTLVTLAEDLDVLSPREAREIKRERAISGR
jgi:hypothetical protein